MYEKTELIQLIENSIKKLLNETKWMNLNQESAKIVINWLKKNIKQL